MPGMPDRYDAIVIGAGHNGLVAELLASLEPDVPGEARSADEWVAEIERRARAAIAGAPGLDPAEARARREALLAPEARGGRG